MNVDRTAFLREIGKIERQLDALLPAARLLPGDIERTLRKAKTAVRDVAIDVRLGSN